MQQYMNLYPPNDFNYLLKLHPRTSLNDSIDSTKNIIGDNAPICIFNSNLPFELILSNDLEYASEHDNKGYLFEDDGAGDFSFKTAIAG
jgi:hypothetical protein